MPIIQRIKLLEILVGAEIVRGREFWVSGLLALDAIPLSPAILNGLREAFPSIPRNRYIKNAGS